MGSARRGDEEIAAVDFVFDVVDAEDAFASESVADFVKRMGMEMVSPPAGLDESPVDHFRFE